MLYRQVKRQLINDIQCGSAAPGAALPNEKDLAQRFQVSVGTVRRAVDELVAEHVLLRQQGRGTFVGKLDRERFMFQFFKIVPRDGASEFPEVLLHKFSKSRATQLEAQALGLHGKPVIHDKITISESMFPGLNQAAFNARATTIYGYYQAEFGVTIVEADERVRAELIMADSARLLDLNESTPILRIDRVAHTFDRKPAEFRTSIVDTQSFDYVSRMREMK